MWRSGISSALLPPTFIAISVANTTTTIILAASATRTIMDDEYVYPSPAAVAVSCAAERVWLALSWL